MDILALSPAALVMALGAGFGYGCSGLVNKRAAGHASPLAVMGLMFVPCLVIGIVGFALAPDFRLIPAYWLPFGCSVLANCLGNFCYLAAMRSTPISLIGASTGLLPVIAALLAWLLLGETLSGRQWLGIGLSFLGLVIAYIPPREDGQKWHDGLAYFKHRGAWLMVGAAFGWAAASPFDKQAAHAASVQLHMVLVYAALIVVSGAVLAMRRQKPWAGLNGQQLIQIGTAGLLRGLAYNLQLAALVLAPVGLTELAKRIATPLVTMVGGKLWFHEPLTPTKLIGTAIFLAALPLVVLK